MKVKLILLLGIFFIMHQPLFSQADKLQIRLERTIKIAYHSDEAELEELKYPSPLPGDLSKKMGKDKLYKVVDEGRFKAYAYVGSAPSKERDFDYLILFTPELKIEKGKVLIYRESHGREIDTPRWLAQFEGLSPQSTIKFRENIDNISGATISARSMTNAVKKVLEIMGALEQKQLL